MPKGWITIKGMFDDYEAEECPAALDEALCAQVRDDEVITVCVMTVRKVADAGPYTHFVDPMAYMDRYLDRVFEGFL